jgi:amidase
MSAPDPTTPALELAAALRRKDFSAVELLDACLDAVDRTNSEVNAVIWRDDEDARARARKADERIAAGEEAPFLGVPIPIKDLTDVHGDPVTYGSRGRGLEPWEGPTELCVDAFERAGFVRACRTNTPEFGHITVSENLRWGVTRNPWDLERTPGGSSGGSAAAVAAGMVPIATANDGGGSTRVPAACCGLVGLKPQRGRISLAPDGGESLLVQDGVLTRSVAETALLLDVLAGSEPGDASWAPPPDEPFASSAAREPAPLRIALTTSMPLLEAALDPDCARAAHDAAELLAGLGHEVVEADPPWKAPGLLDSFAAVFGPAICTQIAFAAMLAGREPEEADMEPLSWALWRHCKQIDAVEAAVVTSALQSFARSVITWAQPYDAILTPALAQPPVAIGELDPCGPDPMGTFRRSGDFTPYTVISNVTGSPAISLPLYARDDGLPLAVQLIGRPAQEGALLALAAQLERARPWAGRRAPTS